MNLRNLDSTFQDPHANCDILSNLKNNFSKLVCQWSTEVRVSKPPRNHCFHVKLSVLAARAKLPRNIVTYI